MSAKFVAVKKISELRVGDRIRSSFNDEHYIVTANYGEHATAVSSIHVTNPHEWLVLREVER